MENSTILRIPASFRLKADLLNLLKARAKASNRSLNNYVESVLMNAMYNEPNEETAEAMKEARSGKGLKTVDMSNFESFVESSRE